MTSEDTSRRVLEALGRQTWPTANELSKIVHLHANTVREHLGRLVVEGLVQRVLDPDVPSPRGSGADRYQRLAEPLGPPAASHDVLCAECARVSYGDPARYRAAMTDETRARLWESYERADAAWDRLAAEGVEDDESRWPSGPQCERCGSAV